ncbi:MAG: acyl-CoA dehydrogenase family protein [Acidimicrobiia bacterium]
MEVLADEGARVHDALDRLLRDHPPGSTPEREFWEAQFDAGLAFVDLPAACGGLGVSPHWRDVVAQTLADAGASFENIRLNPVGHGLCADTLAMFGTPEQWARYLRKLFTAEEIWCQLFSEPGAGSDVASLATRAERDGDGWVVNGQKVWSSFAKQSARGLLIARTDPDVVKHAGLTAFVLDTRAPGVDIRPLVEMTGGAHFNEVFLDGVRIPDSDRIGDVDGGWRVVAGTLANERALLTGTAPERAAGPIDDALRLWAESTVRDPVTRDALVRVWVESECLRLTNARAAAAVELGRPEPDGALRKLHNAELNQRIYEVCIRILGAAGMVERPGGGRQTYNDSDGAITWAFLRSRANTIEGGTSEVMRNIAGERVLGLPAEARADKGVPWSQMLRN